MYERFLCGAFFACCAFSSYSQGGIVQGPFKLDVGKSIFIKNEPSKDYPLGLYYDSGVGKTLVDKYETDGDSPSIDTVFL